MERFKFFSMIWKNFYQISIILKNEQKKREIRRIKELKSLEKKIVIVDAIAKSDFAVEIANSEKDLHS